MKPKKSESANSSPESVGLGKDLNKPIMVYDQQNKNWLKKPIVGTLTGEGLKRLNRGFLVTQPSLRTSGISTQVQSIKPALEKKISTKATSEKSTRQTFLTTTYSAEDFPVSHSRLPENGRAWRKPEERYFTKLCGLPKPNAHRLYCLKTSKDYFQRKKDGLSTQSFRAWLNWGTLSNGKCWTANFTAYHNTEKECSLSDILENSVEEKYFLSDKAMNGLKERAIKDKCPPVFKTAITKESTNKNNLLKKVD